MRECPLRDAARGLLAAPAGIAAAGAVALAWVAAAPPPTVVGTARAAGSRGCQVRVARAAAEWVSVVEEAGPAATTAGAVSAVESLAAAAGEPLALLAADLDEDGVADLIDARGSGEEGRLAVRSGNPRSLFPTWSIAADGTPRPDPASAFEGAAREHRLPIRPELAAAGDWNADGHLDIVVASRGGERLWWLAGDGSGALGDPVAVGLPGQVRALASGEVNRADGLADLMVGVDGAEGPALVVLEGPGGALAARPEAFPVAGEIVAVASAQLDDSYEFDIAVAAGRELVVIHGRDRRLSLDRQRRDAVPAARVERRDLGASAVAMAIGRFGDPERPGVAVLVEGGALLRLTPDLTGAAIADWEEARWSLADAPATATLARANLSLWPNDDLLLLGRSGAAGARLLHVPAAPSAVASAAARAPEALTALEIDAGAAPVAVLPLRLNPDALDDLVVAAGNEAEPRVIATAAMATFVVNDSGDAADKTTADGLCATAAGTCTLRAALTQNNTGAGGNAITFAVSAVNVTTTLPQTSKPVTIDGTAQGRVQINGSNATLAIWGGSSTVRGLALAGIRLGSVGNRVEGSHVGLNAAGTAVVPGPTIARVSVEHADNWVGGTSSAARNVIASDGGQACVGVGSSAAKGNRVLGNFIGTDGTGAADLNAGTGVSVGTGAANTTIGGTEAGARNVIAGANYNGVRMGDGASGTLLQGNFVGLNASGTAAVPNAKGVFVDYGAVATTIGSTTPAARNVISGNTQDGVEVIGTATGTVIQGNRVGTSPDGTAALGNGGDGIRIWSAGTVVGGVAPGAGNLVSGNAADGVRVNGDRITVQGNLVGTDAAGVHAVANGTPGNTFVGDGIFVSGEDVRIGGTDDGAGNLISGNLGDGIEIFVIVTGLTIQGNAIGTTLDRAGALGNAGDGVNLAATAATVGVDAANTIANNGGHGVRVRGGTGNRVRRNSIDANGKFGIGFYSYVVQNDPGDADTGPNMKQNFPVLSGAAGGTVVGALDSAPGTRFTIDVYASPGCDASGYGEGKTWIGSTEVTTDGAGNATFGVPLGGATGVATATATDPDGNTSQLSECLAIGAGAPRQLRVTPAASTVSAGESVVVTVEMLRDGVRDVTFAGDVTLQAGAASTAGIGRLQVGGQPTGREVTVHLAAGAGSAVLLTPEEELTATTVITPATVLAGTAVLQAAAAGAEPGSASVEVTSPLDLWIERIEVQQGTRVTPNELAERFVRGRKALMRIYIGSNSNEFPLWDRIEGLEVEVTLRAGDGTILAGPDSWRRSALGASSPFPRDYVHRRSASFSTDELAYGVDSMNTFSTVASAGIVTIHITLVPSVADKDRSNDGRSLGPLTFVHSDPFTLLWSRTRFESPETVTAFPSRQGIGQQMSRLFDLYPVSGGRVTWLEQPNQVVSQDPLTGGSGAALARWLSGVDGANVVAWVHFVDSAFIPKVWKWPHEGSLWGIAGYAFINGHVAVVDSERSLPPNRQAGIAAHEVGHILGLGDTYKRGHELPEINPRRADASPAGNPVEAGAYIFYAPQFEVDGDAYQVRDFMGSADFPWFDRLTWRYLQDALLPPSAQAPAPRHARLARRADAAGEELVLVRGVAAPGGGVELSPFYTLAASGLRSEPGSGSYAIVTLDAAGNPIDTVRFEPDFLVADAGGEAPVPFAAALPFGSEVRRVRVARGQTVLAEVVVSATAPSVTLGALPAGSLAGTVPVSWSGSDPDGDGLLFSLFYSPDGAVKMPVVIETAATSAAWNVDDFPSGPAPVLVVAATDGTRSAEDRSAVLQVPDRPPWIEISSPADGLRIRPGSTVVLSAGVIDPESGLVPDAGVVWQSSRDGALGTGAELAVDTLSLGQHTLTATCTDGGGNAASDQVTVEVTAGAVCTLTCSPLVPVSVPYGVPATFTAGVAASDCTVPVEALWELGDGERTTETDPGHAYETLGPHGWRLYAASGPYSCEAAGSILVTPPAARAFDFGTSASPLAAGHTRITEASTYTVVAGFGWERGSVASRDRGGAAGDLERDFVFALSADLAVDLPNGPFAVTITMGDAAAAHDQMGVFLEGAQVGTVSTAKNQFDKRTYLVLVADGRLNVRLQDLGGADPNAVVNVLSVEPESEWRARQVKRRVPPHVPPPCTYSMVPTDRTHGAAVATGTVAVSTPAGCSWTASSSVSWLHVESGAGGVGPGTIGYRVDANTTPDPRSGTIAVAAEHFTVTQDGTPPPQEISVSLPGGVPLRMRWIPSGTFMMGSPEEERGHAGFVETLHQVTLTRGYYLGAYEVTQQQWTALMGANPAKSWGVGTEYPVYYVSWDDIAGPAGFLAALNAHVAATGQDGAGRFRLPTSAEWERAARAGTATPFSFGDDPGCSVTQCTACSLFDRFMWWCGNRALQGGIPVMSAQRVGRKEPNPWGLYDMHGNVGEWVADWEELFWGEPAVDPQGPATGTYKVVRNGGWNQTAKACRSARSEAQKPATNWSDVGFRIARWP